MKDQMLPRGYISDNWHLPDAEFAQIVEGMRRLKPACDELATASAANNMGTMQEIDETVLQLVKDCGQKLANTIRTNNQIPPPGPGVPPAQVIVRPMVLSFNVLPQCQWSIAMAVVPNVAKVLRWPMLLGQPKKYLLPQRIPKLRTLPQYQTLAQLGQILRGPMLLGQAKTYVLPRRVAKLYLLPRRIPKLTTLPPPQARPIP